MYYRQNKAMFIKVDCGTRQNHLTVPNNREVVQLECHCEAYNQGLKRKKISAEQCTVLKTNWTRRSNWFDCEIATQPVL